MPGRSPIPTRRSTRITAIRERCSSPYRSDGSISAIAPYRRSAYTRRRDAGKEWPKTAYRFPTGAQRTGGATTMTLGRKILIIDDDLALRHSLAEQLQLH